MSTQHPFWRVSVRGPAGSSAARQGCAFLRGIRDRGYPPAAFKSPARCSVLLAGDDRDVMDPRDRSYRPTCGTRMEDREFHLDGVRSPSRYVSFCMPSRGNRLTSLEPLLASYSSTVNYTYSRYVLLRHVFRRNRDDRRHRHHVGIARTYPAAEYTRSRNFLT